MEKTILRLANGAFYSGVILGLYALSGVIFNTVAGVCPIDARRPLMITAVALLLLSVLGQWYGDRLKKNHQATLPESEESKQDGES